MLIGCVKDKSRQVRPMSIHKVTEMPQIFSRRPHEHTATYNVVYHVSQPHTQLEITVCPYTFVKL